jgi:hypothetical protein
VIAAATMYVGDAILLTAVVFVSFGLGVVAERIDARQRPAQREPRRFPTRQHHYKQPPRSKPR